MLQKKPLKPFELVMRNLPHCSREEMILVAKWLGKQDGVELWSKTEALQAFEARIAGIKPAGQIIVPEIIKRG